MTAVREGLKNANDQLLVDKLLLSVFYYIMVNTSEFNLMHIQCLLSYKTKRTVLHYGPRLHGY